MCQDNNQVSHDSSYELVRKDVDNGLKNKGGMVSLAHIIHTEKKNTNMRTSAENKHWRINNSTGKAMRQEKITKMIKPSSKSLHFSHESLFKCKHNVEN